MCFRLFSQSLCVCVSSQAVLHNSITTVQYTVTEFCTLMLSLSALHRFGPVSKHVHTFRSKCTETKTHTHTLHCQNMLIWGTAAAKTWQALFLITACGQSSTVNISTPQQKLHSFSSHPFWSLYLLCAACLLVMLRDIYYCIYCVMVTIHRIGEYGLPGRVVWSVSKITKN